ncbi:MAG: PAC2 family protein [Actinomycetota bacterium]|nr:PAC2 family protein [Actinomycetota bacterium]
MSLHTIHSTPDIENPIMLVALDSFGDAGAVQASALDLLRGQLEFTNIASFDADTLLDFRVRRPTLKVRSGLIERLTWPAIELDHAIDYNGKHVLLLHGAEPDRMWRPFIEEVLDLAIRFDVSLLISVGSFPGPVPHTLPTQLATTTTEPDLASAVPYLPEELEVPSSIHGAIEHAAPSHGVRALGLWAPVPQYAAMQPYPAAAVALFHRLNELTGLVVNTRTLQDAAEASHKRIEEAIADKPEHLRMVQALEQHVESMETALTTEVPSGDELAAEFQQLFEEGGE